MLLGYNKRLAIIATIFELELYVKGIYNVIYCVSHFSCSNAATAESLHSAVIDSTSQPTPLTCPLTNDSFNKTLIIVSVGVVVSLLLVVLIVTGLRTLYKPVRPRIKKTFVVRNKMDQRKMNRTPMTCRPAAEQCEITIEDCCNMNICDTVSFTRWARSTRQYLTPNFCVPPTAMLRSENDAGADQGLQGGQVQSAKQHGRRSVLRVSSQPSAMKSLLVS